VLRLGTVGFPVSSAVRAGRRPVANGANGVSPDWVVAYTATNSGTFSVLVSSYAVNGIGTYRLHYFKSPGSFIVPTRDEGGGMINGGNYSGTNELADLDPWTFTANAGDTVILRIGTANFSPLLNLYGPSGSFLASAFINGRDAYLPYQVTNSGTYTVLVQDYFLGEQGAYTLHFIQIPALILCRPATRVVSSQAERRISASPTSVMKTFGALLPSRAWAFL